MKHDCVSSDTRALRGEFMEGRIFNVQRFSTQDGPGIRTTVFLKGCPLTCAWCHNPESQDPGMEIVQVEGRCISCGTCAQVCPMDNDPSGAACLRCGACADACPTETRRQAGKDMTSRALADLIARDRTFFEESGGGVTFGGGEPLLQTPFILEVLDHLDVLGVGAAIDTCGYVRTPDLLAVAARCQVVLYDVKMVDPERHERWTGVSSTPILQNLKTLSDVHSNIWLRVPVIPTVNDSDEDLAAVVHLAAGLPSVKQVNLLPYHKIGVSKFARTGRDYELGDLETPSKARMEAIAERFKRAGLNTKIGG